MKRKLIYAGIGSRDIPEPYSNFAVAIAAMLAMDGCTLRSGGASGSDTYFELGCDHSKGEKEIYLPFRGFNGNKSELHEPPAEAYKISSKFHPYWNKLSDGARALHARNAQQVLGLELDTPCNFIVCYTKDGKEIGGTSQAIRIAKAYNIPIYNLGSCKNSDELERMVIEIVQLV